MAPSVTRGWIDGAWPVCQRHDDRGGVLPSRVACVSSGFHLATVIRREMPSPGMVRLIFGGEGLRQFRSTGIGDEYLRLFFPDPAMDLSGGPIQGALLDLYGAVDRSRSGRNRHRLRRA
jgi:NADPH-dependent ferric siderophore reductase